MPRADANEALAQHIGAGVEAFNFDALSVVGCLLTLDPAHQRRIAQIVFHLVQRWGIMGTREYSTPDHPMYEQHRIARLMMGNVGNLEIPR